MADMGMTKDEADEVAKMAVNLLNANQRIEELEATLLSQDRTIKNIKIAERERLKPWLRHPDACESWSPYGKCNCGLAAALGED